MNELLGTLFIVRELLGNADLLVQVQTLLCKILTFTRTKEMSPVELGGSSLLVEELTTTWLAAEAWGTQGRAASLPLGSGGHS